MQLQEVLLLGLRVSLLLCVLTCSEVIGQRVIIVSSYKPTMCGIATYTEHFRGALGKIGFNMDILRVKMGDTVEENKLVPEVVRTINGSHSGDYVQAAAWIVKKEYDIVVLMHEYGIFGGWRGEYVLNLLRSLALSDIVVHTHFHTIVPINTMDVMDIYITRSIVQYSNRVFGLSKVACNIMSVQFSKDCQPIPHGAPPFYKESDDIFQLKLQARRELNLPSNDSIILAAGLFQPGKSIDVVMEALSVIVQRYKNILLVVAGTTHPHYLEKSSKNYVHTLRVIANRLDIERYVTFRERFLPDDLLEKYVIASDFYALPYGNLQQTSSGSIAIAAAAGTIPVSTPFLHANELTYSSGTASLGVHFPPGCSVCMALSLLPVLRDEKMRSSMALSLAKNSRYFYWSKISEMAKKTFQNHKSYEKILPLLIDRRIDSSSSVYLSSNYMVIASAMKVTKVQSRSLSTIDFYNKQDYGVYFRSNIGANLKQHGQNIRQFSMLPDYRKDETIYFPKESVRPPGKEEPLETTGSLYLPQNGHTHITLNITSTTEDPEEALHILFEANHPDMSVTAAGYGSDVSMIQIALSDDKCVVYHLDCSNMGTLTQRGNEKSLFFVQRCGFVGQKLSFRMWISGIQQCRPIDDVLKEIDGDSQGMGILKANVTPTKKNSVIQLDPPQNKGPSENGSREKGNLLRTGSGLVKHQSLAESVEFPKIFDGYLTSNEVDPLANEKGDGRKDSAATGGTREASETHINVPLLVGMTVALLAICAGILWAAGVFRRMRSQKVRTS